METLIIHPENKEQADAVKAILKVLNIDFEKKSQSEESYDPEFLGKIKKSEADFERGAYKTIKTEDLWK